MIYFQFFKFTKKKKKTSLGDVIHEFNVSSNMLLLSAVEQAHYSRS